MVTKLGLDLALFFLRLYGYALGLKRASMPPIFGLAIARVVSALVLFENIPLKLNNHRLWGYAVVIYNFGIKICQRLIVGLFTTARSTKAEM